MWLKEKRESQKIGKSIDSAQLDIWLNSGPWILCDFTAEVSVPIRFKWKYFSPLKISLFEMDKGNTRWARRLLEGTFHLCVSTAQQSTLALLVSTAEVSWWWLFRRTHWSYRWNKKPHEGERKPTGPHGSPGWRHSSFCNVRGWGFS